MCYQSLTLDNETKSLALNEKMKILSRNKSFSCSISPSSKQTNKQKSLSKIFWSSNIPITLLGFPFLSSVET